MKKTCERLLSVILALALLCMPLSETVYAKESEQQAVEREKNGDSIDAVGRTYWEDISFSDCSDITEESMQNVSIRQAGTYQVFRFVPAETKEYTFFSIGSYDTHGMIGKEDGTLVDSNDDGEDDCNFAVRANLNAGETYYCVAQFLSSEEVGSFFCMVSSERSFFRVNAENIAGFEILEPAKDIWYGDEAPFIPMAGLKYRITTNEGVILEGTLSENFIAGNSLYGVRLGGRYKYMADDGSVDTTRDDNAIIYYLFVYTYDDDDDYEEVPIQKDAEVPIKFGEVSPVASIEVTQNPWTQPMSQITASQRLSDRTGLKLTVTYTDETTKQLSVESASDNSTRIDDGYNANITYGFRYYGDYGRPQVGENAVIISYLGKSVEVPVTIQASPDAIEAVKNPEKMFYGSSDDALDLYGLQLSVHYSDGTDTVIEVTEHGSSFSDENGEEISARFIWGDDDEDDYRTGIRISYLDCYTSIDLELPVTAITIERNPDKMSYTPLDRRPDLYGMVLRISYHDGTSKSVQVTEHNSYYRVNDGYGTSISAYFTKDDNENFTGVRVNCMRCGVTYAPQFTGYAPLLSGAAEIKAGQTVSVSLNNTVTYRVFRFVAPGTGTCTFRSSGNVDTYVHLADAAGKGLATNDDGADDGNFSLSYKMEQGKTYYYIVRMYSMGDTGNFMCSLTSDAPLLNKTSLRLAQRTSEKLTAALSAALTGKTVTWKSSNTAVATVSPDGTVTAVAPGTCVITASVEEQSATCQVTVPCNITYYLNGGTNNAENPASYFNQTIVLKAPSRAKYTFEGWYTDSKCAKQNKITQIAAGTNQNYSLYAKWTKVSKPGATKLLSLKNAKGKKISVKCKKVKKADGYEIAYSTSKKFKKSTPTVTTKKPQATIKKLKKGKTYYVRVRAYNIDSTGSKIGGAWTAAKKVKVKK